MGNFFNIIKLYQNCLDLIIIISSFFFIFWLLSFIIPWEILQYILILILFFLHFTTKGRHGYVIKNKIILKFSKNFLKIIKIIGSIIVIFLFLNSYFKIVDFLSQRFLNIIPGIEKGLNVTVITIFIFVLFMLSYIYFSSALFSFIQRKINHPIIAIAQIIVLFLLPLLFLKQTIASFTLSFSEAIYYKSNWLIGFSLIFLHLNYLIKEIKLLKGRNITKID